MFTHFHTHIYIYSYVWVEYRYFCSFLLSMLLFILFLLFLFVPFALFALRSLPFRFLWAQDLPKIRQTVKKSPPIEPKQGIHKEINVVFHIFVIKIQLLNLSFCCFSRGSWRVELRKAGMNHFHLSWYLILPWITSYGQQPWGICFCYRLRDLHKTAPNLSS